jgi:hypothetical protein
MKLKTASIVQNCHMGSELRLGLIKALVFANSLKEYDSDWEQYPDAEVRIPLPKMLVRAARTALVLQLTSLFDEGLQEYLTREHPNQRCDRLRNRIEFLKARNLLEFPDRAERILTLRNALAHEPDVFPTWDDWWITFVTAKRELVRLKVIDNLEAPVTEPESSGAES